MNSLREQIERRLAFDLIKVANESVEQMNNGVATDSAYIRSARLQHAQTKGIAELIAGLSNFVELCPCGCQTTLEDVKKIYPNLECSRCKNLALLQDWLKKKDTK